MKYVNVSLKSVSITISSLITLNEFDRQMRKVCKTAVDLYYEDREERRDKIVEWLYEVIIVNSETRDIKRVLEIATTQEFAKFAVLRKELPEDANIEDYDIFVGEVGVLKVRNK